MRIIYEADDGKQFDSLDAAIGHEKKNQEPIQNISMYSCYDKKLEINHKNFRLAYKIIVNDVNELLAFNKAIKPYRFSGESAGTWIKINMLDTFNSKWVKSRSKEEIARLVRNGKKADIFIRDGVYAALVDDEI